MLVEFKSRKIHLDPAKLRLAFAETMGHALRAALINSTANVKLVTRANSVKIVSTLNIKRIPVISFFYVFYVVKCQNRFKRFRDSSDICG